MGTFSVEATVANPTERTMRVTLPLLVDTGATWTTLPSDIAADIGASVLGTRRVRLADGRVEEWPAAAIHIVLDGHEGPTFCLIGPRGGPSLLGAVTLEELGLAVDPAARRLVPATGYLMALAV
jgi:clan AA aspartic protease